MIDSDVEIDDVEVDDVELNYDEVVMIEPTPRKRKRGKSKVPAVPSAVPDVDGTLTVVVHLITLTASGDQLTKSKIKRSYRNQKCGTNRAEC